MTRMSHLAGQTSWYLNRVVEFICGILMILLVLDIWLGIFNRYFYYLGLTWTEEIARYIMIWVALLAVSCGIARREHIGLLLVFNTLPAVVQRPLLALLDLISFSFFVYLVYFGIGMVEAGFQTFARAFGMPMAYAHAAVPVSAAVAAVQVMLVAIRDQGQLSFKPAAAEVE